MLARQVKAATVVFQQLGQYSLKLRQPLHRIGETKTILRKG
jgi:hypothetical protein